MWQENLFKHLLLVSINDNEKCLLFKELTKIVECQTTKITNRDMNYKKFHDMKNHYSNFILINDLETKSLEDYELYSGQYFKCNEQEYEKYLNLYNKLINEKSILICLHEKISIALRSFLSDINTATKITNQLKKFVKRFVEKGIYVKTDFSDLPLCLSFMQ